MLTEFGKNLRRIRLEHDELLKDMADHLGVSSAYLSAVENGKKKATKSMLNQIIGIYQLTESEANDLEDSFHRSSNEVTVKTDNLNRSQKDLTMIFARKVANIDDDSVEEIMKILRNEK